MGLVEIVRKDFCFYRSIYPGQGRLAALLDRRFLLCANYRFGFWACHLKAPLAGKLMRCLYVVTDFIISGISGAQIRSGAVIGQRFHVHTTFGLLITNGVVMGDDCIVNTGACVVNKANNRNEGQPHIGNHVYLGAGCKVLGGITIGNNAMVGANAVVIRNVPADNMAVGSPARNIPPRLSGRKVTVMGSSRRSPTALPGHWQTSAHHHKSGIRFARAAHPGGPSRRGSPTSPLP